MVTAETALTLPAIVLVLLLCLSAVQLGIDRVRCVDAARVAVRELARGESAERAGGDARRVAPAGSSITLGSEGGRARATVTVPLSGPLAQVRSSSSCDAVARMELVPGD